MNKKEFFDQLHKQLGEKYNITPSQVKTIRSLVLHNKKTRKEIAEWLIVKVQPTNAKRKKHLGFKTRIEHYQSLLNFVASCFSESWEDILQNTEFDKG